ncbi:hypothetical protein RBU49_08995 [Clostridium sp. MB40-C1]|uniref:hypothetical protein n=1 Tax=Clostridium sp. MB40-C1 TaxID=3070996 RepID=UPI0027E18F75|nr:hypothetical protein [Clostridium sp. MB40-C1]WMJ82367.1 hypothetical protein RBU49_08995 [Clostridium sp. MB40-C1]
MKNKSFIKIAILSIILFTFVFSINIYAVEMSANKKEDIIYLKKDTIQIVPNNKARIEYIKLVGLTSQEINEYTKQDEGDNGKRILYDFDGYSDFFSGIYPDEETLKERTVRRLAQKGVGEINWCLGTTCMLNYNSKYAGKAFDYDHKYDNQLRDGDKLAIQQLSNILKSGKSPIEIIAEEGKKLGVKVNASLRMNAFYPPEKYGFLNGTVYNKYVSYLQPHQELMNYKYPQFRTYVKNILKEVASFENVSGVTLDFCRYPTVMSKEVKQEDKIKIMNQFMKEVRNEIPTNKTITVRIPYKDTLSYGFDIETWVRNGYIDRLVPSNITIEDFFDITPYVNMVKGTKVKLYIGIVADVKGHDLTKEEEELIKKGLYVHKKEYLDINQYLSRAYDVYKKGADGLFLFNTTSKILIDPTAPKEGEYLGDKVKIEKWYKEQYNTENIGKQKVFISKNTIESFLN